MNTDNRVAAFLEKVQKEPSEPFLTEIIEHEYFHQIFWPELCQKEVFTLSRRNDYKTDELFINHPILGCGFDEYHDGPSEIGGVIGLWEKDVVLGSIKKSFYYSLFQGKSDQSSWYELIDWIDFYQMDNFYLGQEDSLVEGLPERHSREDLVKSLLTLSLKQDQNLDPYDEIPVDYSIINHFTLKYGFELRAGVKEYLEHGCWNTTRSFDIADMTVDVSLNEDFENQLAWSLLPMDIKEQVYQWLIFGVGLESAKLREDCIHFLGCMALHESTPPFLKQKLEDLNIELVNQVLNIS